MPRRYLFVASLLPMFVWFLTPGASQQKKQPRWQPSPHIAPTDALPPAKQRTLLQVPPGFEIQLVAAEPDIKNPMNIAFDAKGRLWVTMSSEYPFPTSKAQTKDTVKILEDFGPDGRARKITTFAENLNIPIGVLPMPKANAAIVFSIPNVWYLEDTDGDGKADKKKVLLKNYGQRDTHGLTGEFQWGFDGWVYACHGFSNTSTIKGTDGSSITMQSGNTYRFKPDGTQVNYHTHGQVNPFGLAFDPLGNLFSCDCHSQPIYQLLRGAWYPSFSKPHDGLGFGPPMMTNHHGSTAIAGIAYYAARHFPKAYHDNLFIGNVVTNRVNHDSLRRIGSTYRAKKEQDLVISKDRWFRPVDIKLGPDGAVYICDFYNRIIGHYEVPLTHPGRDRDHGRIWRVVYRGKDGTQKPKMPRPDWTKASLAELATDLGHANLKVRLLAGNELVSRGDKSLNAVGTVLAATHNPVQEVHALWVLERLGALPEASLWSAANDKRTILRVHAMRILAGRETLTEKQLGLAIKILHDKDALVQRTAAQVLGNHPRTAHLKPLLDLQYRVPKADTHLLHVIRMAIRDQMRPKGMWAKVAALDWSVKDLRALTFGALSLRNEEVATFLTAHLDSFPVRRAQYARHIARYGSSKTRQALCELLRVKIYPKDLRAQANMITAIHEGTRERGAALDSYVQSWAKQLTADIFAHHPNHTSAAIDLAGLLSLRSAEKQLQSFVLDRKANAEIRSRAAAALGKIDVRRHLALLQKLLADGRESKSLRRAVVTVLAESNLAGARKALVKNLATAPASLQQHIALHLATSRDGADELLTAVAKGKASARILQHPEVQNRLRRANPPRVVERYTKLTKGLKSADARLLELLQKRRAGFANAKVDVARGKEVFAKNCAACHQLNGQGGKIAPQLDGVGIRGPDRLLEDLLDPNRNVDQEFRASIVVQKSGQIFTGLLLRKEGQVLVFADAEGKEKRFEEKNIAQRIVGQTSPMPANLGDQLPAADLYHLLGYLLEQRTQPKAK